jgi:hypothetical protein
MVASMKLTWITGAGGADGNYLVQIRAKICTALAGKIPFGKAGFRT